MNGHSRRHKELLVGPVTADDLVLKHQGITTHSIDYILIVPEQFNCFSSERIMDKIFISDKKLNHSVVYFNIYD